MACWSWALKTAWGMAAIALPRIERQGITAQMGTPESTAEVMRIRSTDIENFSRVRDFATCRVTGLRRDIAGHTISFLPMLPNGYASDFSTVLIIRIQGRSATGAGA